MLGIKTEAISSVLMLIRGIALNLSRNFFEVARIRRREFRDLEAHDGSAPHAPFSDRTFGKLWRPWARLTASV